MCIYIYIHIHICYIHVHTYYSIISSYICSCPEDKDRGATQRERPHPHKSDFIHPTNLHCSESAQFCVLVSCYFWYIQFKVFRSNSLALGSPCVAPIGPDRSGVSPTWLFFHRLFSTAPRWHRTGGPDVYKASRLRRDSRKSFGRRPRLCHDQAKSDAETDMVLFFAGGFPRNVRKYWKSAWKSTNIS